MKQFLGAVAFAPQARQHSAPYSSCLSLSPCPALGTAPGTRGTSCGKQAESSVFTQRTAKPAFPTSRTTMPLIGQIGAL